MIDEIPVRDPLPRKRSTAFSLEHLAIFLGLIFATLLVLLLCSKGFDLVASKIWPQPQPTLVVSKVSPTPDKQQSTIAIPVEPSTSPPQAQPNVSSPKPLPNTEPQASLASMVSPLLVPTPSPVAEPSTQTVSTEPISLSVAETPASAVLPEPVQEPLEQNPTTATQASSSPTGSVTTEGNEAEKLLEQSLETVTLSNQEEPALVSKQKSDQNLSFNKKVQPLNPDHYTLQIIAMYNRENLQTFIKKNRLNKKVKIYQSELRGKPWYVAVYGDFASRAEALQAISYLPVDVQEQKPWIRSVASLQRLSHVAE